jgi:signal recognition particle receptor subunit beta
MPVVNPLARELVFKVVYYGPGLGGKTTTLQYIHAATRAEHRGKMVSLATPVDRTLYFDFLPIRLPNVQGLGVRLQLFTVPGQVYYNATRKLVLTGADAVVFVADSQQARLDANLESLENLRDNLREHGRALNELPFALAYNKRDLSEITAVEELERRLNRHKAPYFETCATTGEGVFETLDALARLVLEDFERRMPDSRSDALPGNFRLAEGGLVEALRAADHDRSPHAPQLLRDNSGQGAGEDAARLLLEAGQVMGGQVAANQAAAGQAAPGRSGMTLERASLFPRSEVAELARSAAGSAAVALASSPRPSSAPAPLAAPLGASPVAALAVAPRPAPAAGAVAGGVPLSFVPMFPDDERALAREVEGNLQRSEWGAAVLGAGALVRRCLARLAPEGEAEPVAVVLLATGIDAARYLWLRRHIGAVRSGSGAERDEALEAYLFAADVGRRTRSALVKSPASAPKANRSDPNGDPPGVLS